MDGIRERYREDWKSKDTFKQQMGVALYFIDKLALRAGHEKDEDEADTVGCCTLKVSAFLASIVLLATEMQEGLLFFVPRRQI